jgi:transposase-like protein
MSKYSSQFKLRVVQEYLKLGGLKRLAKLYSINTSDIRNWTLAYQSHGLPGLQKRGYQRYTPEFKIAVLEYMKLNLIGVRPTAAHFNIAAPSTITIWQRLYNEGGITALQSKPRGRPPMPKHSEIQALLARPSAELTHEELLRKAQYLEVENAYLKKLEALAQQKHLASKNKSK